MIWQVAKLVCLDCSSCMMISDRAGTRKTWEVHLSTKLVEGKFSKFFSKRSQLTDPSLMMIVKIQVQQYCVVPACNFPLHTELK